MKEEIVEDNFLKREECMEVAEEKSGIYCSSLLVIGSAIGCAIIFLIAVLIVGVK